MKHNWEYKRLGDVCIVVGGSTPRTDIPEYWDGEYNWFTPAEINGSKYYAESERKITTEAVNSSGLTLMPIGTVLLTSRAPIGKLGILKSEAFCNQGFKNLICKEGLYNEYLYFALQYFKEEIQDRGRGATFKEISKKVTESIQVPVPPMEVQERIVAELDKINELIDKNRELLRHLDSLAQSLFYATFGDPVTNPKGWEIHPFSDVFKLNSGDGLSAKQIIPGQYPVYGGNGIVGYHQNYNVDGNNVIIGRVGALCGNVRNVKNKAFVTDNAFIVTQLKALNQHYITFMLNILNLRQYAKTVAQPVISNVGLKNILIQVPPLVMQEQFAAKVEAIEAQKATIEKSIAELQTLLDSRMDYWFN